MGLLKNTTNKITRSLGKLGLKLSQSAPEIFFVVGIVGVGVATVELCRKTLKTADILDEHNERLERINEKLNDESEEYSEDDAVVDKRHAYISTGKKLTRNYAPGVLLMIGSITCLCKSHNLLKCTITNMASAYAILDEKFQNYRNRTIEAIGEDKEKDIYYGVEDDVEHEIKEDGEVVTHHHRVPKGLSSEARVFAQGLNPNWRENPAASLMFLRAAEKQCNTLYDVRGYLFLNEAYEILGYPITPYGQVICWVKGEGDNRIDFGINNEYNRAFLDGKSDECYLDFNHDGIIYEKIAKFNLKNNGGGTYRDIYDLSPTRMASKGILY